MDQDTKPPVPVPYWVISIVAVLWNLLGCLALGGEIFAQDAMMKGMTDAQIQWARDIPSWIYLIYALAVYGGLYGSIMLLLRKKWSIFPLSISFVAVIVQMVYTMVIAGGLEVMGWGGAAMPAMVICLAGFFVWFSMSANSKGWLST